MNKKERERQFEEINGRRRSESKLTPNKKKKNLYWHSTRCFSHSYLGKYFLIFSDCKERVKSSIVCCFNLESTSQSSTSQGKTDETDKDKQEEIQKLKDQLTALDTKKLRKQKHLLASSRKKLLFQN